MQDRIKQMAEKTGVKRFDASISFDLPIMVEDCDGEYITLDDAVKIAQLVAKDCVSILMEQFSDGALDIADEIRARYGIKE